jgi:hypothetical protein
MKAILKSKPKPKKVTGFFAKECHDCFKPFTVVRRSDDTVNVHDLLYPICVGCSQARWNTINWDA